MHTATLPFRAKKRGAGRESLKPTKKTKAQIHDQRRCKRFPARKADEGPIDDVSKSVKTFFKISTEFLTLTDI